MKVKFCSVIYLLLSCLGEIAIGNRVLKRLEESLTADYTSHELVADILYSQVTIGNRVLKRLEESLTADYTSHELVADILYSQVLVLYFK